MHLKISFIFWALNFVTDWAQLLVLVLEQVLIIEGIWYANISDVLQLNNCESNNCCLKSARKAMLSSERYILIS